MDLRPVDLRPVDLRFARGTHGLVAVLAAARPVASATAKTPVFISGSELYRQCAHGTGNKSFCDGYVAGISDVLAAGEAVAGQRACAPLGTQLDEAVAIGFSGLEIYGFHTLEVLQCMVERRRGGETGLVSIQALRGNAVWKAMKAGSWEAGGWDPKLFEACLCRSHTLASARKGFNQVYPTRDQIPGLVRLEPIAYIPPVEYEETYYRPQAAQADTRTLKQTCLR